MNEGDFDILVGASSRDIRLTGTVHAAPVNKVYKKLHMNSTMADVFANPVGAATIAKAVQGFTGGAQIGPELMAMLDSVPVRALVGFSGGKLTTAMAQAMLDMINGASL